MAGRSGLAWVALGLMLTAYVALAVTSLVQKSVTVDEFAHLPAGHAILSTGDLAFASLNPPLMNALSALPPLWLYGSQHGERPGAATPHALDRVQRFWEGGYRFMEANRTRYHSIFVSARLVTVLVAAGLGLVCFVWARRLAPDQPELAGILAASLVLFSPDVLAHGRLVTTDLAAALSMTTALLAMHGLLRRPGLRLGAISGIALGLAQLVKFSAIWLYPVLVVSVLVEGARRGRSGRRELAVGAAVAVVTSLVVINVGYGFDGSLKPLGEYSLLSAPLGLLRSVLPGFMPLGLPEHFVGAFDFQLADAARGDPSYLLGQSYLGGRWYYYAVLIAAKTPPGTLILVGLALASAVRKRSLLRRDEALLLLTPAALLIAASSLLTEKQLGIRMILPALTWIWLWTAVVLARAGFDRVGRVAVALLVAWSVGDTLRAHPDYLSYFSPLVGGAAKGPAIALDSNLDWGQDLIQLRRALEEQRETTVQLLYFGRVDPALYDIEYTVPVDGIVRPGLFAISATLLARSYPLYDHGRLRIDARPISLDRTRFGAPIASPGASIFLFRVPGSSPPGRSER